MHRVYLGVGSNLEPEANIPRALDLLRWLVRVDGISTFYRTDPVGPAGSEGRPRFVNGVLGGRTRLTPAKLKAGLRRIEADLGRRRTADRYAPRTIDLDILLYDNLVQAGDVTVPDPAIQERPFLAVPLAELEPGLVLPGSGRRISEVAAALAAEAAKMEPLPSFTTSLRKGDDHES